MNMNKSDSADGRFLGDYLFNESPATLLVAGALPEALLSRPVEGVSVFNVATLADAQALLSRSGTSTETSASHAPEGVPPGPVSLVLQLDANSPHLQEALGQAVRSFPHRVLVHIRMTGVHSAPDDDVLFALGFRRLVVVPDSQSPDARVRWFEYRLSEYKHSPEWLNARFWANPERFSMAEEPDVYCESSDDDYEDDDEE